MSDLEPMTQEERDQLLQDAGENLLQLSNAVYELNERFNPQPSESPVRNEAWALEQERLRVERWHRTRDAALTGLLASPSSMREQGGDDEPTLIEIAGMWADRAHGPR
jgi:hypothetical protein